MDFDLRGLFELISESFFIVSARGVVRFTC